MKNFFHILNPNRANAGAVKKFFRKNQNLDSMWVERTSHPTHLETLVEWAVNEGRSHIAIWGGDGTLSRAIHCLHELNALSKMTVALFPAGTCNDFAKYLNLPNWKRCFKIALEGGGEERKIDVGLLESGGGTRAFINNAGFGRTPNAIGRKSNAIRDIFSFTEKSLDLEWKLNGSRQFETRRTLLGIVFNAPYFNGGMHFKKSIQPDDGILNGFFEDPQPRSQLLMKFIKSRLGGTLAGRKTFEIDFNALRFESNVDLYPQADGEPAFDTAVRFMDFSILPKALRLITWR